jgi:hypothetical protein
MAVSTRYIGATSRGIAGCRQALTRLGGALQAVVPIPALSAVASAAIDDPRVANDEQAQQTSLPLRRKLRLLVTRLKPEAWVALLASVASVTSYVYYVQQGVTLAYVDSIGHIMIARSVFASNNPGLAQLGTVWLPLNHMLMLPLVWNDTLFRDGFAGTFPSMVAYVVSVVYIYRLGAFVFSSRAAGWVAALVLMLNPSVLYMQSTPMSEMDLICFAIVAIYYAVRWARALNVNDLVKCALATAAGTLVRYDGWALALAILLIVCVVAWRRRGRQIAESHLLLFGTLGLAGCAAWLIYQTVIFKNPLDFLNGPYSAHAQQQTTEQVSGLPTHHNALLSLNVYAHATFDALTWPIAAASLLGLLWWIFRTRLRISSWPVYSLLVPFVFNWLSLVLGITVLETPDVPLHGIASYYNVRYGMMMIPAAALFVGSLMTLRRELMPVVLCLTLAASTVAIVSAPPYALQDPLSGASRVSLAQEGHWLASNYHGGTVLVSNGTFAALMFDSGLPDRTFVSDGDGSLFHSALVHPETVASWIIMTPSGGDYDPVWAALHNRSDWREHYVLRKIFAATEIYQRIDTTYAPASQSLTTLPLAAVLADPRNK